MALFENAKLKYRVLRSTPPYLFVALGISKRAYGLARTPFSLTHARPPDPSGRRSSASSRLPSPRFPSTPLHLSRPPMRPPAILTDECTRGDSIEADDRGDIEQELNQTNQLRHARHEPDRVLPGIWWPAIYPHVPKKRFLPLFSLSHHHLETFVCSEVSSSSVVSRLSGKSLHAPWG